MHALFSIPKQPALTVGLSLLFAGCNTTTYTVQVDAISQSVETSTQTGPAPQSYYIRSKNSQVAKDSLRYKEVSDYVKTALSGKGMYEAPHPEKADVVIEIDYGMETPRMKYEKVAKPIIVKHEGLPTREIVAGRPNPDGSLKEKVIHVKGEEDEKIIGWRDEIEPVVVYEKYLKLSARENRETMEGRAPPEVWSVNVSAEDESNELRRYMPVLASATADYIGTNTKESKPVTIDEKDEVVKFIKKGM